VIQTNRLAVQYPDADVVLTGHTHDDWLMVIPRMRITERGNIHHDEQLHIRVPGYKDAINDGFEGFETVKGHNIKSTGAGKVSTTRAGVLYICGSPWRVTFTDGVVQVDLRAVHGATDKFANQIAIATDGTAVDKVRATLVHEVLHACISAVLNSMPDDEEPLVQGQEVALYSIIRDPRNKWVWDYLLGRFAVANASRFNGSAKVIISALIGLLAGGVSAGIYFGTQSAIMKAHVESQLIHEKPSSKENRIDSRIKLHLVPMERDISHIKETLRRIEEKM
jgi:hypothetical protein